jgi:hypothetical protein
MEKIEVKKAPSCEEILRNLKREFSNTYAYDLFGLGSEKSIIVRKSPFVGVQISKRGNGFSIQAMMPLSVTNWFLSLFLSLYASGAMVMWTSPYKKLENEIALFLKNRYE